MCGLPCWVVRPMNPPRARGSGYGVRSPDRYGRKSRPSLPGGTPFASSTSVANVDAGGERVPEPPEAAGRRQHHSHHVPSFGHRVTERMEPALRIDERSVGGGEHDPRGSEREGDDTGHDGSHAHGGGGLIASARDHRRSRAQPGRLRGLRRDRARDRRPFVRPGEPGTVDPERLDHLDPTSRAPPGRTAAFRSRRPGRRRDRPSVGAARSPSAAGCARSRTTRRARCVAPTGASVP